MMDALQEIRRPIAREIEAYRELFRSSFEIEDDLLGHALSHVLQRGGKLMRPTLVLLTAKEFGEVSEKTLRCAATLEILHTATLIHDDVVDESDERRGQTSVNVAYGNKMAVLVGDFLLSKALHLSALTGDIAIVDTVAKLGGTLAEGEVKQIANIREDVSTEEAYMQVLQYKTCSLFSVCGRFGAYSTGNASEEDCKKCAKLGDIIGTCFQIRDDIFDYFDNPEIGKPTGNDMYEGKLTLPAIYALQANPRGDAKEWALRVKKRTATPDEIADLVKFTKENGGIEYAQKKMESLRDEAMGIIETFQKPDIRAALTHYLDFTIGRNI